MIEEIIYKNYGIHVEKEESLGQFPSFRSENVLYSIIPLEKLEQEELVERQKMSEHLSQQGDRYVSSFVMANHQSYISEADGHMFLLLANNVLAEGRDLRLGRKLALFHARARSITYPIKKCSRLGNWKILWEQRIDQLEKMWKDKLHAHPNNQFEKLFVETFPYYMALGENAIQYLADTEIDDNPSAMDAGTICYDRFANDTWSGKYCIKNPFDWIFDNGSRDISEWIRQHYFKNQQTYQPGLQQFLHDYQSVQPLTSFSSRLLYARLIFPIHYFETIEGYYSNPAEARSLQLEDEITVYTEKSVYYEEFLRSFYDMAGIPVKQMNIPLLSWL
ncbi:spore coat protein YutH [Peribacillus cavernae]|uniref:Spore coat protein YutH n=1 Tax=Peribacillus cavernae TaxID=1674310 RepID=A0A433HCE9_9BACI|nr:spore coat protein YutH [Peribacillus cavernae]MDQ0219656.1 spore coat protein YutH [Peribacillus cavernae]RUQ25938.1 spore coat protein YutH [Peribacillus cavernae]